MINTSLVINKEIKIRQKHMLVMQREITKQRNSTEHTFKFPIVALICWSFLIRMSFSNIGFCYVHQHTMRKCRNIFKVETKVLTLWVSFYFSNTFKPGGNALIFTINKSIHLKSKHRIEQTRNWYFLL